MKLVPLKKKEKVGTTVEKKEEAYEWEADARHGLLKHGYAYFTYLLYFTLLTYLFTYFTGCTFVIIVEIGAL